MFVKHMIIKKEASVESQILPRKYLGNKITRATAVTLMKSKPGKRNQINGLVYSINQMPTKNNDNGWNKVLRSSNSKQAFQICTPLGKILVHFSDQAMNSNVSAAVNYFLNNHSKSRETPGESGTMVSAGVRLDLPLSTRTQYVRKNKNNTRPDETSTHLQRASVAFDDLITTTCCNKSYQAELNSLKKKNNVFLANDAVGNQRTLFPSYAISQDLTNSVHLDTNDDSRSYAVFYRVPGSKSQSWQLFPLYKIAIECATTVFISWEGRSMRHCSCTVKNGVYYLFASSYKDVTTQCVIEKSFKRRKYNTVSVGE